MLDDADARRALASCFSPIAFSEVCFFRRRFHVLLPLFSDASPRLPRCRRLVACAPPALLFRRSLRVTLVDDAAPPARPRARALPPLRHAAANATRHRLMFAMARRQPYRAPSPRSTIRPDTPHAPPMVAGGRAGGFRWPAAAPTPERSVTRRHAKWQFGTRKSAVMRGMPAPRRIRRQYRAV